MNANVSKLLNEQINKEFYSAYLYLDFANYYAAVGLDGFENCVPASTLSVVQDWRKDSRCWEISGRSTCNRRQHRRPCRWHHARFSVHHGFLELLRCSRWRRYDPLPHHRYFPVLQAR